MRKKRCDRRALLRRARRTHSSTMRLRHVSHDGEAESSPASFSRTSRIDAIETLEDSLQVIRCDSFTGVANTNPDASGVGLGENSDDAVGRVPDCILDEVREDLANR